MEILFPPVFILNSVLVLGSNPWWLCLLDVIVYCLFCCCAVSGVTTLLLWTQVCSAQIVVGQKGSGSDICVFLLPAVLLLRTVELFVDSDEQALSYDLSPLYATVDSLALMCITINLVPHAFTYSRNHSPSLLLVAVVSYFPTLISSSFYFCPSSVYNFSWPNWYGKVQFLSIREKHNLIWSGMYMGSRGWVQNFCLSVRMFFMFSLSVPINPYQSTLNYLSVTSRSSLSVSNLHSFFNSE